MSRFSHTLREQRRLWRLLGELAAGYWEHAAADRTPVVERRGRRAAEPLPLRPRSAAAVLRQAARYLGRNACHLASPRYYGLMNPKPALAGGPGDAPASGPDPQLPREAHAPRAPPPRPGAP